MINTTNITDANTFLEQTTALNIATGGFLFTVILFALFVVIMITFLQRGFKEAFLGASAFTSLIGVGFWSLELISFKILIIPLILTFVGLVAYLFTKD